MPAGAATPLGIYAPRAGWRRPGPTRSTYLQGPRDIRGSGRPGAVLGSVSIKRDNTPAVSG